MKGADLQMLPSSFRAMEHDLHLAPSQLAMLALCQGVACAVSGPLWGNLVDSGASRKWLLQVGAGLWGLCTMQLALTSHFAAMMFLRVVNGAALAMMVPVMQSFVADLTDSSNCGSAFGKVACAANVGQVLACLIVTPISEFVVLGMRGWRLSLLIIGALSLFCVLFVRVAVHEEPSVWKPRRFGLLREFRTIVQFMKIPTFRVIVLQGIFGTIPSAAQSFTTMYLQYMGVSNAMCGLILALRTVGEGLGNALGGYLGDIAHVRRPSDGRTYVAMFSVLVNVPFLYLIFMGVSKTEDLSGFFAGLLFTSGVLTSWEVTGCLIPIVIDIVPKRQLSSAFAWNVAIVFTSGNMLGPMLVGVTAQKLFHYKLTTESVDDMTADMREHNAEALGKSLCFTSIVPCVISALIFTMLFCTYASDKRNLREKESGDTDSDVPEACKAPTETSHLLTKRNTSEAASRT